MKPEFCRRILEKFSNKIYVKILPVGAELFHADRRTDGHTKDNSHFLQFLERV